MPNLATNLVASFNFETYFDEELEMSM